MEDKAFHSLQVLGMKNDLCERVFGLSSIPQKGCDWVGLLVS